MNVQQLFQDLYDRRDELPAPESFHQFTKAMTNGLWRDYDRILKKFPGGLHGKVFLDFGCKYGHVLPQALAMGARAAIGVDVEESYLEPARKVFGARFADVQFHCSDEGLMPVDSDSVDCLLANEVISHINPTYLETFYAEAARVLRVGGAILISDGNNLAHEPNRRVLPALYEAWERGAPGTKTDRDVVNESFQDRRRRIIRQQYPKLADSEVADLAANTSGLFGRKLVEVLDDYVNGKRFIERPYRPGCVPTNPNATGVVMERGFHPEQVELALAAYGIEAHQIFEKVFEKGSGVFSHGLGATITRALAVLTGTRGRSMQARRGELAGFQILGIKRC